MFALLSIPCMKSSLVYVAMKVLNKLYISDRCGSVTRWKMSSAQAARCPARSSRSLLTCLHGRPNSQKQSSSCLRHSCAA